MRNEELAARGWRRPGGSAHLNRGPGSLPGAGRVGGQPPGLSSGARARERRAPGGLRRSRKSLQKPEAGTSIFDRTQVSLRTETGVQRKLLDCDFIVLNAAKFEEMKNYRLLNWK